MRFDTYPRSGSGFQANSVRQLRGLVPKSFKSQTARETLQTPCRLPANADAGSKAKHKKQTSAKTCDARDHLNVQIVACICRLIARLKHPHGFVLGAAVPCIEGTLLGLATAEALGSSKPALARRRPGEPQAAGPILRHSQIEIF